MAAFVLHLCAISRFYVLDAGLFWSVSPAVLIFLRGLGAGFIVLMLLDALNGSGIRRWMALNTGGEYYIWAAFLTGFAKRVVLDRFYFLPVVLLILALALKFSCEMRFNRKAEHRWRRCESARATPLITP